MRELHSAVVRYLKTNREFEDASELWKKLWAAFEKGGSDAVSELLERLAEMPKSDDEGVKS